MFCPKCGNRLPDSAKFCEKCGNPVGSVPNTRTAADQTPPAQPPVQTAPQSRRFNFTAPNFTGEAVLGSLAGDVTGGIANVTPGKVIGTGVKSFFTSIGSAFRDPKRLIPALLLAVIWLVLNILRACGIDPIPTRILSFLTFANGGMGGGVIGAIGGIIGKGIFAGAAAALIGLFTRNGGTKRPFKETVKGAFGVSLDTLWAYLIGVGAAMLLYLFISGGAGPMAFMGGIAAAFLAARAALNNGFLRQFLGSFTAKGKTGASPKAAGIIRGLSVGFAAAAPIGLLNIRLILIIAGSVLFVGGTVMGILQAVGVVKLGKGARVQ